MNKAGVISGSQRPHRPAGAESPGSRPVVKDREPGESAARPRIQRIRKFEIAGRFRQSLLGRAIFNRIDNRKHRRQRSGPGGGAGDSSRVFDSRFDARLERFRACVRLGIWHRCSRTAADRVGSLGASRWRPHAIPVRSGSQESPHPRNSSCATHWFTWEDGVPGTIEVQILDTVLGLSVTPTTVGWVLAEGHGADGTILDHHELALSAGRGVPP